MQDGNFGSIDDKAPALVVPAPARLPISRQRHPHRSAAAANVSQGDKASINHSVEVGRKSGGNVLLFAECCSPTSKHVVLENGDRASQHAVEVPHIQLAQFSQNSGNSVRPPEAEMVWVMACRMASAAIQFRFRRPGMAAGSCMSCR